MSCSFRATYGVAAILFQPWLGECSPTFPQELQLIITTPAWRLSAQKLLRLCIDENPRMGVCLFRFMLLTVWSLTYLLTYLHDGSSANLLQPRKGRLSLRRALCTRIPCRQLGQTVWVVRHSGLEHSVTPAWLMLTKPNLQSGQMGDW